MQTFLPHADFYKTASVLDWRRLGKQRIEAKQILLTIEKGEEAGGWRNHPAVNMWRGYENALAVYGITICLEWIERGYNDNQLEWFRNKVISYDNKDTPPWLGNKDFHLSHRSNLLRKNLDHYSQFWPNVPDNLEYVWPSKELLLA